MHYCLCGHKDIEDDPARIDLIDDMTRLHATLHQGSDESGPVLAVGELRFALQDAPALVASMHFARRTESGGGTERPHRVRVFSLGCASG